MDRPLDDHHSDTRAVLHRIANHVLARAEYTATGRIGLQATPGGFSTISFGPDLERLRVSGGLIVRESGAETATWTRTMAIDGSSLAELADFAEVDLSGAYSAGSDIPSVGDVHEPITLHAASALLIADWYAITAQALDRLGFAMPEFTAPSLVQLWPEHFDIALDMAFDPAAPAQRRVNVGGSPGDGFHSTPYLYVGPWTPERPGDATFWNAPFGAVLGHEAIATTPDPVTAAFEFFNTGLELLTT